MLIIASEIPGPANKGGRRIRDYRGFAVVVLRRIGITHIRGKLFYVAAWGATEEGASESLIWIYGGGVQGC